MRTDSFEAAREYQLNEYLEKEEDTTECDYCGAEVEGSHCYACDFDEDEHRYQDEE